MSLTIFYLTDFLSLKIKFIFLHCNTLRVPENIFCIHFAYLIVSSEQFHLSEIPDGRVHPEPAVGPEVPQYHLQKQCLLITIRKTL